MGRRSKDYKVPDGYITPEEASRILGLSRSTIYQIFQGQNGLNINYVDRHFPIAPRQQVEDLRLFRDLIKYLSHSPPTPEIIAAILATDIFKIILDERNEK